MKSLKKNQVKFQNKLFSTEWSLNTECFLTNEVSTQSFSELIDVLNVKQEESEANNEEKKKSIPCKYLHKTEGCMRGEKSLFYHEYNHKVDNKVQKCNKSSRLNQK